MLRTLLRLFSTIFLVSCFSCSSEHCALLVIVGTAAAAAAACCRPRRLILLEHNFNFCYVANTLPRIERSHTHFFFPSFAFLSFALPHSHRSSLFSTSLICLLQRAPRTPSYRQQAREPIDRVVVHDSSRLNPVSTYPSRILTTNHGTHCIHTRILFGVDRTASSSALLDTCTPDTLGC